MRLWRSRPRSSCPASCTARRSRCGPSRSRSASVGGARDTIGVRTSSSPRRRASRGRCAMPRTGIACWRRIRASSSAMRSGPSSRPSSWTRWASPAVRTASRPRPGGWRCGTAAVARRARARTISTSRRAWCVRTDRRSRRSITGLVARRGTGGGPRKWSTSWSTSTGSRCSGRGKPAAGTAAIPVPRSSARNAWVSRKPNVNDCGAWSARPRQRPTPRPNSLPRCARPGCPSGPGMGRAGPVRSPDIRCGGGATARKLGRGWADGSSITTSR